MGYGGMGMVSLTVFVHRVDTDRFPSVPPGWRWCVSMMDDPSDARGWLNAGWEPSEQMAAMGGESNAVTASRALRLAGVPCQSRTVDLDHDPCPPEAMNAPLLIES
jgi:hypothetical protein